MKATALKIVEKKRNFVGLRDANKKTVLDLSKANNLPKGKGGQTLGEKIYVLIFETENTVDGNTIKKVRTKILKDNKEATIQAALDKAVGKVTPPAEDNGLGGKTLTAEKNA